MTYDLHRLRARGLITRIPHTHRNKITDHGLHAAIYLSAVHDRFLPPGPARLTDQIAPYRYGQPPTHTRPRSTTSPAQQVSPHDTINPTPAHQT